MQNVLIFGIFGLLNMREGGSHITMPRCFLWFGIQMFDHSFEHYFNMLCYVYTVQVTVRAI